MELNRRIFLGGLGSLFLSNLFSFRNKTHYNKLPKFTDYTNEEQFWKLIRHQFPLAFFPTYFNTATVGASPFSVIDAVKRVIDRQEMYGEYAGWENARQDVANLINAKKEEISLTHNTTEGINIVANGLPLTKNDEIIMCSHEHAGNALAWLHQAKKKGFQIRVFEPATTVAQNLEKIENLLTKKTKLIALPHVTCTTGLVFPIAQISQLAKQKNIWTCFDGAQGLANTALDIKKIGCDFYAACGHKWLLAPKGTGFLYVKEELLDSVAPTFVGTYSDIGWELTPNIQQLKGYAPDAHRYDYGTQSAALWAGVQAAILFLNNIGIEKTIAYSQSLADYLQQKLLEKDHIQMLTPTETASKSCMVSFKMLNTDYKEFGKKAQENKFRVRLVAESQLDAIRISTYFYNTKSEIDRFLELL